MRRVLTLLAALLLFSAPGMAQDYPNRPIRVLEPLAAGSAVDIVARIVADKMGRTLGGSLFVDNQPGAAGLLGMRAGATCHARWLYHPGRQRQRGDRAAEHARQRRV